jgi:inner membrane protein
MDSLTQIVLGAATGEVVLGKKAGNKAILWGAVAGTIPDLDVFASLFLEPVETRVFHRGFMHSIFFCILFAPVLGYLIYSIHRKMSITWKEWSMLAFWSMFTHPLLDIFTTWGTQLLWPLDWRISINSVFVIDPLYTVPFIVFLIIVMRKNKESAERRKWNRIGILVSSAYLLWSVGAKEIAHNVFEDRLQKENISYSRLECKPMPLTTFYWEALAETSDGFYTGHYSLFGKSENIQFRFTPKNHHLAEETSFAETEEFKQLVFFSQGSYALSVSENGLNFMDLRFGMTDGITNTVDPNPIFIFHLVKENEKVKFIKDRGHLEGAFGGIGSYFGRIFGR